MELLIVVALRDVGMKLKKCGTKPSLYTLYFGIDLVMNILSFVSLLFSGRKSTGKVFLPKHLSSLCNNLQTSFN